MVRTDRKQRSHHSAMMREIVTVLQTEPRYALAVRRIDAIERRYLESAPTAERISLQQSAARMALIAATDKDASYSALARRYLARTALGFWSVESELAVVLDFAFACADNRKRKAGLAALSQADQVINKPGVKRRSESILLYRRLIAKCRSQLDRPAVKFA